MRHAAASTPMQRDNPYQRPGIYNAVDHARLIRMDYLGHESIASDTLLSYRQQFAERLVPLNVRSEDVELVLGRVHRRFVDMALRQVMEANVGKHFIPLFNDQDGHKVYAMELSSSGPWKIGPSAAPSQRKKLFALLGVRHPSPTALSLYRGPVRPITSTVGLYGLVEVSGSSFSQLSNVADTYSHILESHNLRSFLEPM